MRGADEVYLHSNLQQTLKIKTTCVEVIQYTDTLSTAQKHQRSQIISHTTPNHWPTSRTHISSTHKPPRLGLPLQKQQRSPISNGQKPVGSIVIHFCACVDDDAAGMLESAGDDRLLAKRPAL